MPGYGQFCPVALSTEVLGRRWTLLIVRELMVGSERFNDLRRGLPRITASMLARRLEELRLDGIVTHEDGACRLTPAGSWSRSSSSSACGGGAGCQPAMAPSTSTSAC